MVRRSSPFRRRIAIGFSSLLAVATGYLAHDRWSWSRTRQSHAAAAVAPAPVGSWVFAVHFEQCSDAQLRAMQKQFREISDSWQKRPNWKFFGVGFAGEVRSRSLAAQSRSVGEGSGYQRAEWYVSGLAPRSFGAAELRREAERAAARFVRAHPDLRGARLRLIDESGVVAEIVCTDRKPADWPLTAAEHDRREIGEREVAAARR